MGDGRFLDSRESVQNLKDVVGLFGATIQRNFTSYLR